MKLLIVFNREQIIKIHILKYYHNYLVNIYKIDTERKYKLY